ncbi:Hypothetical protein CINCED_3A024244 [Cinara cedri]|uniref:Uncharacterized protein n=1 Tax=Cinara cedri TaxID=506608 RepID=A0A5E4NTH0_9HEMI|nr:Hypothetical protein CINCED_3A024244 [Cinara cedri]
MTQKFVKTDYRRKSKGDEPWGLFLAKPEDIVTKTAEEFCNRKMSGLFASNSDEDSPPDEEEEEAGDGEVE